MHRRLPLPPTSQLTIACALLVLLAGCEAEVVRVPPRTNTASPSPTAIPHAPQPAAVPFNPAAMNVKVGTEKDLEAMIAAHQGKPVYVDYWATWCHPCVDEFPHTVELFEKYGEQGLVVIAVSFDVPEDEQKVREFLARHRAPFENLISVYGIGSESVEKFDVTELPQFRLYDRAGKLHQVWKAAPRDVDQAVKSVLAKK